MRPFHRSESGQAAGIETVPFGILVFVAGTLLVVNAWAIVDARAAVDAAARDYLRAYTSAPDAATASRRGTDAAVASLAARSGGSTNAAVTPPPQGFGACFPATVRISSDVPQVRLPFVGSIGTTTVTSTQTEVVQPHSSAPAVAGSTPCQDR